MSWDEVEDQITIPRMQALYSYWEENPPIHRIAAAMAGIEPRKKQKQYADVMELIGSGEG